MPPLTAEQLSQMIDQTLLTPYASHDDLRKHCLEAARYGFKTVAINNAPVPFCKEVLRGSGVLCDAAVSFPLGQCTVETKVFETIDVIAKGADEVDYVVNLGEVKNGNWAYIADEMRRIVAACRERGVTSKVIFENCYLTDDEKKRLCDVALAERPDFIKTSTGFGTPPAGVAVGATVADVRLMKACVGDSLRIKAAGGIRTVEDALAMIESGANRIGTSRGVAIVEGYRTLLASR
ncbi:MAG: deoxyribose-phosphate aldolase [Clostridiales bacterium]|nr:deoxyribose-phosphate aldolase [Clostridiales bacterium]